MSDRQPKDELESKSHRAHVALRNAGIERQLAQRCGSEAEVQLKDAERLEGVAAALMKPVSAPVVKCGEVVRAAAVAGPAGEIVDTLSSPDQAAIDASVSRTDLLLSASTDIVALGVDAAQSMKAKNSLEKMLAHQLALIHALTMRTGSRALDLEKRQGLLEAGPKQTNSIELARLGQTTSRLASAFQEGLLTYQRMRCGGTQTVTVRHVTVEPGGQAVIGNVTPGGRRSNRRRVGGAKNGR